MKTIKHSSKVLYTAKVHIAGGRGQGKARSSDGHLDISLSTPGIGGKGTNPEQLLAAGWAACFEDAISIAAYKRIINLPGETTIDAEIDLCANKSEFTLQAKMQINIPELAREVAEELLAEARLICPYTAALENNIFVEFILV